MTFRIASTTALLTLLAAAASAQPELFGRVGMGFDFGEIGGSGVNESGAPFSEPTHMHNLRASGELGAVWQNGFVASLALDHTKTDVSEFNSFGAPADNAAVQGGQQILSAGYLSDGLYVGGFAGLGNIKFTASNTDDNAIYRTIGAGLGVERDAVAVGFTLSMMDVIEADDFEVLDRARIAKIEAIYTLPNGNTELGVYALHARGEMDTNIAGSGDAVSGPSYGIFIEHRLGTLNKNSDVMLNFGIEHLAISEDESSPNETVKSTRISFGVSIEFGGTRKANAMRVASAPDMTFVQMMTPMLD